MTLKARTRRGERLLPGRGTLMARSVSSGLPVASSCSGRGACARCLVAILEGSEALLPMSEHEADVLRRNGAAPGTRLACQTRLEDEAQAVVITTGYW